MFITHVLNPICLNIVDHVDHVDLIKIYFASKLKSKLTVKTQTVLKNIIGIGLITFGILMFFKAF